MEEELSRWYCGKEIQIVINPALILVAKLSHLKLPVSRVTNFISGIY